MLVIPTLSRRRQEDHKSEVSLGYTARPFLEKKIHIKQNNNNN
jgi:hypothetical protein